ncbi:MAG: hypothetical protein AAGC95_03545 [Pseudomonadota bacterium]
MKKVFCAAACLAATVSAAAAHGPPDAPAAPEKMPNVLFDHPVLITFTDLAILPVRVNSNKTIEFMEINLQKIDQSVADRGAWTWKNGDFCIYPGDDIVCFAMENEVTPGIAYNTQARMLNLKGEEQERMPVNVMLVRSPE